MTELSEPMSTREFLDKTGATYRQLDYWVRQNVFFPIDGTGLGSGQHRLFSSLLVGPVTTLVHISKQLDGSITTSVMADILDAYDDGVLHLGDGIELRWAVL